MSERCDVCGGREIIRLPIITPVTAREVDPTLKSGYREFPCPACAPWAEVDRVKVMRAHCIVRCWYKNDPNAMTAARHSAAHQLVETIARSDDFLRIATGPAPISAALDPDSVQVQVTLGVISKSTVATIEERVAQHQEALAREVMAEAVAQIENFGAYYRWDHISKKRAAEFVRGALATVLERRREEADAVS